MSHRPGAKRLVNGLAELAAASTEFGSRRDERAGFARKSDQSPQQHLQHLSVLLHQLAQQTLQFLAAGADGRNFSVAAY